MSHAEFGDSRTPKSTKSPIAVKITHSTPTWSISPRGKSSGNKTATRQYEPKRRRTSIYRQKRLHKSPLLHPGVLISSGLDRLIPRLIHTMLLRPCRLNHTPSFTQGEMVEKIAKIQEDEANRPVTTVKQIPRNNEFNQSQTSKRTDSTTNRTHTHQRTPPQNTEEQHALLPTVHLHTGNGRYSPPHIHLPKIRTRKTPAHTENRQEEFLQPQPIRRQKHYPPYAHLPQQNWTIQARFWRH